MKAINLENFGIIAGAVAVAFIFYKAMQTKNAMQGLAGMKTQYNPVWADDITGNMQTSVKQENNVVWL